VTVLWADAWDDVPKKSIGAWMRHKRKTRGMQQQQLANVLGVSRRQVQHLESGVREPSMKTLVRLCEFFREMPPAHGGRLLELCQRLELLKVEDCCQRGEISNLKQEAIEEEAAMERAFFERFDGLLARLDRIAGLLEARMSGAAGVARAAVPAPVAPVRPAPVAPVRPAAVRAPAPVPPVVTQKRIEEYPMPVYPPGEAPWDKIKVTVAGKLVQPAPEQAAPALEAVAASLAATTSVGPGAQPEGKVKKSRGRPKKAPEAPAPVNAKDVTPPLPFQDQDEPDLSDKALVDAQRAALVAAMEKASGADLAKRYERAYGLPYAVGMTREFLVNAIVEALVNPKAVPPPPPAAPAAPPKAQEEEQEDDTEADEEEGGDLDVAVEAAAQQAAPEGENLW
jgi:transcriptional regulator with XRE-family HTH domain